MKIANQIAMSTVLILLFSTIISANVPESAYTPSLSIKKVTNSIKIDGKINETEWSNATSITSYIERDPGDNIEPSVKTETFITYDEDNLYVSF